MIDSVSFTVNGFPAPKGSFTHMPNGAMLPAGSTASRKKASDWRNDIRHAAEIAMGSNLPVVRPVRLMVDFSLPYPKSSVKKYEIGWLPHTKKPDIDKLLRMLLDALTGIVWADDSQVIISHVNKSYAWNDKPGARITCDFLSTEWLKSIASHRNALIDVMENHGV